MTIRTFQKYDQTAVEEILVLYWTDPDFLAEISNALSLSLERASVDDLRFLVAEQNDEIVGIVGFKKLADYFEQYVTTRKPVELYVIAAKYRGRGIGEKLGLQLLTETKNLGITEILLYSPTTHQGSWEFYEKLGFVKVGEITPPEDEIGAVWQRIL